MWFFPCWWERGVKCLCILLRRNKYFGGHLCYNKLEVGAERYAKQRDNLGACGRGGVGVQKCPDLPFTSQLTFILLAPLLLLCCDETDGFAAAIFIVF